MAADQPVAQTGLGQLEDLGRLAVRWTLSWLAVEPLTAGLGARDAAGDKTKALDALRQGLAIMVRMTSLSPENAVWKGDLAWFEGQIVELAR